MKVKTHEAGPSQLRKPQRELAGTLSFGEPVPLVGGIAEGWQLSRSAGFMR